MDAHTVIRARGMRIDQHGQLLNLELNLLAEILRLRAGSSNAHGHCLADKSHLAVGEGRASGDPVARHRVARDDIRSISQVFADEH